LNLDALFVSAPSLPPCPDEVFQPELACVAFATPDDTDNSKGRRLGI
jgi:hypothetical protein